MLPLESFESSKRHLCPRRYPRNDFVKHDSEKRGGGDDDDEEKKEEVTGGETGIVRGLISGTGGLAVAPKQTDNNSSRGGDESNGPPPPA